MSAGCLSVRFCSTDDEEPAIPYEVSADTALERSPSAARVSARREFTSLWSACRSFGGLVVRLEVSWVNASHNEVMSPANNALQREITRSCMLRSRWIGPLRCGTLRQSLARAACRAHACGVFD